MPKEHLNMMFGEGMDLNLSREEREREGGRYSETERQRKREIPKILCGDVHVK